MNIPSGLKPLGHAQYTTTNAAIKLTAAPDSGIALPDKAKIAILQVEAAGIRYTDDNKLTPTAAIGFPLAATTLMNYDGDLAAFKFIQQAAGAILNVAYYG